jgi:hypothetical protein
MQNFVICQNEKLLLKSKVHYFINMKTGILFDGSISMAKYKDNEPRGSVAVSFNLLKIQSSAQNKLLSKI